jgi:putative lipoprotein
LAAFLGCAGRSATARADSWWAADKALHFAASAGIGAAGYGLASLHWREPWERALVGASLSLSAGIAKELWDLSGHGDPSWKDLTWDAVGTGVGVGLAVGVDVLLFRGGSSAGAQQASLRLQF